MLCTRLALAALLPALGMAPGWSPAAPALDDDVAGVAEFPEFGLTFHLGALGELKRRDISNEQMPVMWTGDALGSKVELALILFPGDSWPVNEPIPIRFEIEAGLRRRAREGDVPFRFTETWLLPGEYGYAAYAAAGKGPYWEKGEEVGEAWCLAGLLEDRSYALRAMVEPAPSAELAKELRRLFEKGVAYDGPVRDPEWTDEEAEERWRQDVPEDMGDELDMIMRTDHYIVMSNKRKSKLFGRKMEEFYKEVKEVFPFEDCEGQKLMPVFVFITPDQYYDYYVKIAGITLEGARRSGGHAWKDYYAAPFNDPNAPVHIHEATHQIFHNRMFLGGGGSWFQEGVAEYVSSSKNDRNVVANAVKKGRHVPLREFVALPSLLYSSEKDRKSGGSAAGDNYKQAALLIEFLRDSKWARKEHKGVFEQFVQIMGTTPRGDVEAIEGVFQRLYGVGLDALDAQFVEYADDR